MDREIVRAFRSRVPIHRVCLEDCRTPAIAALPVDAQWAFVEGIWPPSSKRKASPTTSANHRDALPGFCASGAARRLTRSDRRSAHAVARLGLCKNASRAIQGGLTLAVMPGGGIRSHCHAQCRGALARAAIGDDARAMTMFKFFCSRLWPGGRPPRVGASRPLLHNSSGRRQGKACGTHLGC